jgi:hypothetical protein
MLYFIWHVLCFYLQGIATSQQQQEQILEVLHGEEEAAHMEHVAHMEHEAPEEQVAHVEHEAPEEDDGEQDDGEEEEGARQGGG